VYFLGFLSGRFTQTRYRSFSYSMKGTKFLLELRMMNITISQMTFEEISPIVPYVLRGNMRVRNTENTIWFGARCGEEIVGIVSCVIKKTFVYYNTDFVRKEFRGKGIYIRLFEERDKYVATLNTNLIKAKCTPYSLRHYLKKGFIETGKRKSITYVEKSI
jgi:GNAT superfamily N-acetyltransferase